MERFRAMVLYTRLATFFQAYRLCLLLASCHLLQMQREQCRVRLDIIRAPLSRNHLLSDMKWHRPFCRSVP